MFSFAYTSEHISGIKGNLFSVKPILVLFYLIAPLTTPLWLLRGWLWAVLGSGSAQSLLAQPPCPRWPSCPGCAGTLSSAGEQTHLKPGHQPAGKVPEPALCSSQQHSSSWAPWTLLLVSCSGLYANSWGGTSMAGKLANHFQRTRHICFSRLKQEASALKSVPSPKWEPQSRAKSISKGALLKALRGRAQGASLCSWGLPGQVLALCWECCAPWDQLQTSSGWTAGMHFARVISSPSHS